MVPFLSVAAIVLLLAVMWLGAIIVDRYISQHWYSALAHCEHEEQQRESAQLWREEQRT